MLRGGVSERKVPHYVENVSAFTKLYNMHSREVG